MSISLFCSGIEIVDTKIGIKTSVETVFSGPETVSLDLVLGDVFIIDLVSMMMVGKVKAKRFEKGV